MTIDRPLLLVCAACGSTNRVLEAHLEREPACGHCKQTLLAPRPFMLSAATLPKFIARTDLPVVVDFCAPSSASCREMTPQYELAALRMPRVRFARFDGQAHPNVASAHRIRSLPTLVLFRDGREVDRRLGAHRAAELLAWLREQEAATSSSWHKR
jgi:thioredoxin 2